MLARIPYKEKYWIDGRRVGYGYYEQGPGTRFLGTVKRGAWIWTDGTPSGLGYYQQFCDNEWKNVAERGRNKCLTMGNCWVSEELCHSWKPDRCRLPRGYICKRPRTLIRDQSINKKIIKKEKIINQILK